MRLFNKSNKTLLVFKSVNKNLFLYQVIEGIEDSLVNKRYTVNYDAPFYITEKQIYYAVMYDGREITKDQQKELQGQIAIITQPYTFEDYNPDIVEEALETNLFSAVSRAEVKISRWVLAAYILAGSAIAVGIYSTILFALGVF